MWLSPRPGPAKSVFRRLRRLTAPRRLPGKAAPNDPRVRSGLGCGGFPARAQDERIAERASREHRRKRNTLVAATPSILDRIDLGFIRGHMVLRVSPNMPFAGQ